LRRCSSSGVMTASCQRSPANARIDSTSSQTVTYTNSVEDGSRGLPTCWATSPACCDTSGTAVSRRNASGDYEGRDAIFVSLPEFELSGGTYAVGLHDVLADADRTVALLRGEPMRLAAPCTGLAHRPNSSRSTSLGVWPLELQCERSVDLKVAQQEGAFVKSLAPQPAGDFGVALTGVA
jgi:hypothetical protein